MNITKLLFPALGFLVILSACSPESTGFFSQFWHNTTSHYNAYFLAREKMQEVQQSIADQQQRNFNDYLHIYPPLDTVMAKQYEEQLQEIIKMASLAIERHKNSKWVDDSYLLVGKARYYGREMEPAVETFKYINTKSKEDETRHRALIYLMRTFMDNGELNNARGVADYLRKENLNKENLRDYHLALAHYYRLREDYPLMAAHLEAAAKRTKKQDGRAKYYFILGQLRQELGQDSLAYKSFRKVLKSNPDYELSFYARLNLAQVANLAQAGDEKRIRRYFAKLLKDRKNKEYRDKIYYEIGNFEARLGNRDAAIENYRKSIAASVNNPRQKSYAYRKLAEFYYGEENYRSSKAYYDSVMTALPQDEEDFPSLQQRQQIMANLVEQLNVIEQQDSLLRLATMDSTALTAYLEEVVRREEQARILAERKNQEKINQVNVQTGFNTIEDKLGVTGQEQGSSIWYFYNPSLLSIGQAEFVKRWGNRPLEDNWRRTDRGRENTDVVTQAQTQEEFEDATKPENEEERVAARRVQLYNSIPISSEAQNLARTQVETAFYNLGKIFNYDLKEFSPTVESYSQLLGRFPETEYAPEVLYNLYLLYLPSNADKADFYKNQLIQQYPESTFAKIAQNPNFLEEEDQATAELQKLYAQAYKYYQAAAYKQADSVLRRGLGQYPDNSFSDNLELLRVMVAGQTDGIERYQYGLTQFLDNYSESELAAYASDLLQASYDFAENNARRKGASYGEYFDQTHYFIVTYPQSKQLSDELLKAIDVYNAQEVKGNKLNSTNIILTEDKSLVFVSQFADRTEAMKYYRALERNEVLKNKFQNAELETFVISKDNFQTLYTTKDLKAYRSFFKKYYY